MENITAFINHKNYSPNTASAYSRDIIAFFAQTKKNESSITTQDISKYITSLLSNKTNPRTINRKISSLKEYYKFLVAFNLTTNNPTLQVTSLKTATKLPIYLTDSEVNLILDKAKTNPRHHLILNLLYYTGLRVSELCNLKVSSIQDDKLFITGKGNKQRVLPISAKILPILKEMINGKEGSDYIFRSHWSSKKPITRDGVYKMLKQIGTSCGVDNTKLHPHCFRHTTATRLLNNGVDIRVIQEVLGHSSLSTTAIYASVDMTNKQKAIEIL